MRLVIINGFPTSGKDTFIDFCDRFAICQRCSSVDKVKEALTALGWDGIKTPEARAALSHLKDLSTKLFDGPVKHVTQFAAAQALRGAQFVFAHAREPEELERYRREYDAIIIYIDRTVTEPISNHADANVRNFDYDYIVPNNGTLEQLECEALKFIKKYKED